MPKFRPLNTMSLDDAVDELAGLMDAKPAQEGDPVDLLHWNQDFFVRCQELENRIRYLQSQTHQGPIMDPGSDTPMGAPEAAPETPAPKTMAERIQTRTDAFRDLLRRLQTNPHDRRLRKNTQTTRWHIQTMAREGGLPLPELPELPPLPGFVPKTSAGPVAVLSAEEAKRKGIPLPKGATGACLYGQVPPGLMPDAKAAPHRCCKTDNEKLQTLRDRYLLMLEVLDKMPNDLNARQNASKAHGRLRGAYEARHLPIDFPPFPYRKANCGEGQILPLPKPPGTTCPAIEAAKTQGETLPVLHRKIIRVTVAAHGRDCEVVLDDGSVIIGLTSISAEANMKDLASFSLMGRLA
jgi:hypothetical protein